MAKTLMAVNRHFDSLGFEKFEDRDGSIALLSSLRGGISKKLEKSRRNVQWNDNNGRELTEVFVFEPSYVSYASDSEDEDQSDACMCLVM